jgi:tRNA pseudouridine55 synthase
MTDGLLNINKPRGPTSHDVVRRVRALTGIRRVGHAGTLDPLATGVLVICVGQATRVAQYVMNELKIYRALVRLGITTDTYDAEGRIVAETKVKVSRDQVERVLAQFQGPITQVPPAYSAIKHEGTPLHRLARRGVELDQVVQSKARQIEILNLKLSNWNPPECTLEITCSPGTYVRSLAHDLGQVLGCGAHLGGLTRLASGKFHLKDTITLDELACAAAEQRWSDLLHPIDAALYRFPALHLDADAARRVILGQAVQAREGESVGAGRETTGDVARLSRAYGPEGDFLALVAHDPEANVWRPRRVFKGHRTQRS